MFQDDVRHLIPEDAGLDDSASQEKRCSVFSTTSSVQQRRLQLIKDKAALEAQLAEKQEMHHNEKDELLLRQRAAAETKRKLKALQAKDQELRRQDQGQNQVLNGDLNAESREFVPNDIKMNNEIGLSQLVLDGQRQQHKLIDSI